MVFSSSTFIFVFLPILLAIYYLIPKSRIRLKNSVLLLFSLLFYAWGEPRFIVVILISIIFNYCIGRWMERDESNAKRILFLGTTINLLILFVFKYLSIFINTEIRLPIGISFFTFQAISYIIDVKRKKVRAQKDPINLALYISFFPQLIAGPIVRYEDIENQLTDRSVTADGFSNGVSVFIVGLGKKIILANNLALVADGAFDLPYGERTLLLSWLGMICYSLQIYYDFSGYSDMAIGLGKMFGFNIKENFNYPYMMSSISDFWRRWHISLGAWFKEYVYIPLGGSRGKPKSTIRNLFVVWCLTGLWHGGNWTFILWGLFFFGIISIEKTFHIPERLSPLGKGAYRIASIFLVMIGWVVFRSDSVFEAVKYISNLFGVGICGLSDAFAIRMFMEHILFIAISFILAFASPVKARLTQMEMEDGKAWLLFIKTVFLVIIFLIACSYIVLEAYNPFIYFNF